MNTEKLDKLVSAYKAHFNENIANEIYKWKAVKCFQDNWDIEAEDFASMLSKSLKETSNLLTSVNNFPREMLDRFARLYSEDVRDAFCVLFDEDKNLKSRIDEFKSKIKEIHKKYQEQDSNAKQDYQKDNAISVYLFLCYPRKYYIYKQKVAQKVFDELGVGYKLRGKGADAIIKCYEVYDKIADRLQKDKELRNLLNGKLKEDCYEDDFLRIMTVDFAFYVGKYMKSESITKIIKNSPEELSNLIKKDDLQQVEEVGVNYWWLNGNPKVWSINNWIVGEEQDYTLYNSNGNKRRIHKNFIDAKVGDIVICYEANPTKQIVGIAKVSKAADGDKIYFKKTETLISPIDFKVIKDIPELQGMEFLINPNGSFFKLTSEEYEIIISLIREANDRSQKKAEIKSYKKEDFLGEVFMKDDEYERLSNLLSRKKNIILQGAPGVGKTFAAKRLAYSLMGEKREDRVCCIQFHQNYTYEDFIMGYKPEDDKFVLRKGVFYDFCILAKNNPNDMYFLIIDEINRGNLSKIFGELLMLIENDHRGESLKLAYNGEEFCVPKNLYIIGMMNTADRSLAMIDYALRRRFSFFEMKPGFDSDGFKKLMKETNNEIFEKLIVQIKSLNEQVVKDDSLGSGFEIGHSYFCYQNVDEVTKEWMKAIVDYDIIPTLQEYWFDDKSKINNWSEKLRGVFANGNE